MRFFRSRRNIIIALIVFCLIIAGIVITLIELRYKNRFYGNIIVAGESVGGKTYGEVFSKLKDATERLEREGFFVEIASSTKTATIKIPASSQGLTPDTVVEYYSFGNWEAELEKAYKYGRSGPGLQRIKEQLRLVFSPKIVDLPYTIQDAAVNSLLKRELANALVKKREAYFSFATGALAIVPDITGEAVDHEKIIFGLRESLARLKPSIITIRPASEPAVVTSSKLALISEFANALTYKSSVTLRFNGFSTYLPGSTLATWLTLKDEPGVSLSLNRQKLEEYVEKTVNPYVSDAPRNSRFEMRDGVLVEIVAGKEGKVVSIDSLEAQLTDAVSKMYLSQAFNGEANTIKPFSLTVDLITTSPKVTKETIAQYNIRDLVGTVTTSFKGSTSDRKKNIETGVAHITGLLIPPGHEFSAVDAIGYVTEEEGYVEEYVIKGNESVKELGGGLCQIATTLFRLALNAGLPITERQNHKYVVSYYGPGLDATIYGPHPDLRFVNDTKGYLLLQGRISGESLILELYGQKDSRTAIVSEPVITDRIPPPPAKYIPSPDLALGQQKCTETARYGMKAEATYDVIYPDGSRNTQVFKSVYQPWAKVCLVGISLTAPVTSVEGVH